LPFCKWHKVSSVDKIMQKVVENILLILTHLKW